MDPTISALVGAAIGALAGLAGGGLAALAAVRSSQLAARAHLGTHLVAYDKAVVAFREDPSDAEQEDLEIAWHTLSVHQELLCPSHRIETMLNLARKVARETGPGEVRHLALAGTIANAAARMIGSHSRHLFGWRARRDEAKVVRRLLDSPPAAEMNPSLKREVAKLLPGIRGRLYRRSIK